MIDQENLEVLYLFKSSTSVLIMQFTKNQAWSLSRCLSLLVESSFLVEGILAFLVCGRDGSRF